MNDVKMYIALFFIYSFLGWANETIRISFKEKKFVNRGFLIGPICPIYGYGSILMTFFLKDCISNFILLFIKAVLLCGILEYLTSYIMEQIFHARWWDYSDRKFNLNGRICLMNLLLFGLGGCIIMYISNSLIISAITNMNIEIFNIISAIIIIIYIIDNILSFKIIFNIKQISKEISDNTIEISEKVKSIIYSKSTLYRRILESYPKLRDNLHYKKWKIQEKVRKRKNELKEKVRKK